MSKTKNIFFVLSLVFNAAVILFIIFAVNSHTATFSLYNGFEENNLSTAAIVSIPPSRTVIFNAIEMVLKKDDQAALQFSVRSNRQQANMLLTPLYDRDIISVSPTGFGILITALREGETIMQTLTEDGIRDIAIIRVGK